MLSRQRCYSFDRHRQKVIVPTYVLLANEKNLRWRKEEEECI